MIRLTRSIGLTAAAGLALALLSNAPAQAGGLKNRFAKAPAVACAPQPVVMKVPKAKHGCGLKMPKLQLPKLGGHGCGPKLPKLGGHGCGPKATCATPVAVDPCAPTVAMYAGSPQVGHAYPSQQQPGLMPGYAAPDYHGAPMAPGMAPGYGANPAPAPTNMPGYNLPLNPARILNPRAGMPPMPGMGPGY